jgi:hypothetical protein
MLATGTFPLNICYGSIVLKKSESMFCSQFPVGPDLADTPMIQDACRD